MSLARASSIALSLLTLACALEGRDASAAEALPHGVHQARDGRYYEDVCDHDAARYCLSHRLLPASYRPGDSTDVGPFAGAPPQGSMQPQDLAAAYAIPSSAGAGGKIVAIIDSPDANAASDLHVYRSQFGLPDLPVCGGSGLPDPSGGTPCFASVDQDGGSINKNIGDNAKNDVETSLDMDMISAVCPDCSILLVQIPSLGAFQHGTSTAIALGAVAVSISIGGPEQKGDASGYTTPGHLVLAASGDDGYDFDLAKGYPATPSYPASAPDVVSVGGTCLDHAGGSYSETVWNLGTKGGATTSGCSTLFGMPSYQSAFGASHFGDCSARAANDLAAAACFETGGQQGAIAVYVKKYGWQAVNGTSAAAPIVAGLFTRLALTDAVSSDFGFVYQHASAFHDVTQGSDASGTCSSVMCNAGAGWDGPTGVGTPNGSKLQGLGGSSGSSGSSSGSGGGSGSGSGGGSGSSGGGTGDDGGGSDSGSGQNGFDAGDDGGDDGPRSGVVGDAGSDGEQDRGGSSGGCSTAPIGATESSTLLAVACALHALVSRRRRRK